MNAKPARRVRARMKVGILGSGDVGRHLAAGFTKHGHDVMMGSRSPDKLADFATATGCKAGTLEAAAKHGDLVILAVQGDAAENAAKLAGRHNLSNKTLLDATNPLDFSGDGPPGLLVGTTDSLGERIQRQLPHTRVVKCFNTIPHKHMVDPHFAEGNPHMLLCGDDETAKEETTQLLKTLGWPGTIDCGGIDAARWLEAHVALWARVGGALDTWEHAFKVVR